MKQSGGKSDVTETSGKSNLTEIKRNLSNAIGRRDTINLTEAIEVLIYNLRYQYVHTRQVTALEPILTFEIVSGPPPHNAVWVNDNPMY